MSRKESWTGRDRLAPGTLGAVHTKRNPETGLWQADGRGRRLDGSYLRAKAVRKTEREARESCTASLTRRLGSAHAVAGGLTPHSPFAALLESWIAEDERVKENVAQTRALQHRSARRNLVSVLGHLTIAEITPPICEQAYADLLVPRRGSGKSAELPADAVARHRKGAANEPDPGMVRHRQARTDMLTLRKVMQKAVRVGLRLDNPAVHVKLHRLEPKPIVFLTADDYPVLRAAVDAYNDRPGRHGARPNGNLGDAMDITVGLGLRIGETLGIRIADIDLTSRPALTVNICGTVVEGVGIPKHYQPWTKTRKNHRVTVPKWVDAVIRDRLSNARPDDVFLFETANGKPLGTHELRRSWRIVRAWAGLPDDIIPHVLRKSAVTLTSQEVGIEAASRLAAHGDLRTTQSAYDGSDQVPYAITQALEAFDPTLDRDQREFVRITGQADAAADEGTLRDVIETVLRGMGMLPDGLPDESRQSMIDAQMSRVRAVVNSR